METSKPLVSVCLPTYNRAKLLQQSLDTICRQNYERIEIVVSDNGSADETERVCREAATVDPRIRYFRQPHNIGLHQNYNFCFDQAQGEILCFFHDDDLYDPQIVSESVAFLQANPAVGLVCSDWSLLNETGKIIGARECMVDPVLPGLAFIERVMRTGQSYIGCSGAVIRRSALGDIRFDEQGTTGFSDFVVWFRIAEHAAVGHIPKRLFAYRLHAGSLSRRTIASVAREYYRTLMAYCDDFAARWPERSAQADRWRRAIKHYLFWAVAYEVGLHVRRRDPSDAQETRYRTVFEIANYRLTDEEFEEALAQLRSYGTGPLPRLALVLIEAMLRTHVTWPLGWITRHSASMRGLLGLR